MSKKYIEADALLEEIEKIKKYDYFAETSNIFSTLLTQVDVVCAINRQPAADVRENVRGEWVEDELGTTVCSNCKNPRRDNRIKHIAFCNSCGADMRGVDS